MSSDSSESGDSPDSDADEQIEDLTLEHLEDALEYEFDQYETLDELREAYVRDQLQEEEIVDAIDEALELDDIETTADALEAIFAGDVQVDAIEDPTIDLTEVDPSEIDPEDLENQEWTLGGEDRGVIEFGGMTFLIEDPEDDEILNLIVGAATGEGETGQMDGSDRMFRLCKSAVISPELTSERWRDLKSGERIGLTMRIAEWAGIDHMMDFPDGGRAAQPGE